MRQTVSAMIPFQIFNLLISAFVEKTSSAVSLFCHNVKVQNVLYILFKYLTPTTVCSTRMQYEQELKPLNHLSS